jgi:hypothetical protein
LVRSLLPEGGRGIAVFDITNAQSFDNLGTLILALVDIAQTEMTIFVAWNKVDLEDGRPVGARELLPVVTLFGSVKCVTRRFYPFYGDS